MSSTDLFGKAGMALVKDFLHQALVSLGSVKESDVPLPELAEPITGGLRSAYQGLAARTDAAGFSQNVRDATEWVNRFIDLVPAEDELADEGLLKTLRYCKMARHALSQVGYLSTDDVDLPAAGKQFESLRASRHEPRLLDFPRYIVKPAVVLPEVAEAPEPDPPAPPAPAPITSLEELEALMAKTRAAFDEASEPEPQELPPPAVPRVSALPIPEDDALRDGYYGTARTDQEILAGYAQECIEDLSMLGLMRRPTLGEGWLSSERVEQRLLTRLDALVACGTELFDECVETLAARPLPDPELTWGNMFLYGSVKGDDTSDQVMRLAAMAPLDVPDMLESVADALAFVPNPGVEDPLRLWLQHAEAERRIVAARALSRRGSLTMEEGLALTRDRDSSVLVAGADAAVSIRERDRAGLISPLLQHKEEGVVRAAIRASILRGENGGYTRAVELLSEGRGDFADACIFVALSGGAEHGPALFEHATHTKSPASIAALGWFGHLGAVEFLLDRLADEDEAACSAAVVALERILGASLTEITTDPEYPPEALPFERPFVDWEVEMDIFGEPVVWRAWWEKHRGRAKSGARYRYGSEWTIAHVMWEIEQPDAMLDTRRLAHMELVTRLGAEAPFDPEAFVAKQRRQLAAWHVVVQSRGSRIEDASWPGAR